MQKSRRSRRSGIGFRGGVPRPRDAIVGCLVLLLAALVNTGCDAVFGPSRTPTTIRVVPAVLEFDAVGDTRPLSAEVRDQNDRVMGGVAITWTSSNPQVVAVSESGVATAVANGTAQITARAGSAAGTVPASVTQVATWLAVAGGHGQTGPAGGVLADPLTVEAADRRGHPAAGVVVHFAVQEGGGSVSAAQASTGPDGRASVFWTLGTRAGENQVVRATLDHAQDVRVDVAAHAVAGPPDRIAAVAGDGQAAKRLVELPQDLVVEVADRFGNPVSGEAVTFTVTAGGGTVNPGHAITNVQGRASTRWTLGPHSGEQRVSVATASAAASPLTFSATATGDFNIELHFITAPTASQRQTFEQAAARWESIIIGDLPAIHINRPAGHCGSNAPAMDRVVDNLLIFVTIEPIDGPGGVLGRAGPCLVRSASSLPIVGRMQLDVDDVNALAAQGTLLAVILHEMGHVLGIGTVWNRLGFLQNPSLPDNPGADTHFDGPQAIARFDDVGGTAYTGGAKVPVENTLGGQGNRDSHWRQSVFEHELMTGFLTSTVNPLSIVTIGSLADLGYVVNPGAADAFTVDVGFRAPPGAVIIEMKDDVFTGPIHVVDEGGRVVDVIHR